MKYRTGIGQDSHRFLTDETTKPCVIAGLIFEEVPGFKANSDGDIVLHALCNAISSVTGEIILGTVADEILEKDGITDSRAYVEAALKALGKQKIEHVAFSLEGARPKFLSRIGEMRNSVAHIVGIEPSQVGITATTGERLTNFGCGEGVQCLCILTTVEL